MELHFRVIQQKERGYSSPKRELLQEHRKENSVDHYLSGSVHHELASEYIHSLLSLRRICRNLYRPHTYIADTLEANKTCMYQILTQLVNQKVYTIHKSSSLMLLH